MQCACMHAKRQQTPLNTPCATLLPAVVPSARSKHGEPTYLFANILDTDPEAFVAVTLNKRRWRGGRQRPRACTA